MDKETRMSSSDSHGPGAAGEASDDDAPRIHPSAIVHPTAELGPRVEVGPFAVIGADVRVGAGTRIGPHVCLEGPLEMGEDNVLWHSALVGVDPQVKHEKPPFGRTRIGSRNTFREFCQVHKSIYPDAATEIGDDGLLMGCAHVAHDCILGNHVIVANNALLAGHIHMQDHAIVSGNCVVHQFNRIGEHAMVGGLSALEKDVPSFGLVVGSRPALLMGLNIVGLRRSGIPKEVRSSLKEAYRILFRSDLPLQDRIAAVVVDCDEVRRLLEFIEQSERGVTGFGGRASKDPPRSN